VGGQVEFKKRTNVMSPINLVAGPPCRDITYQKFHEMWQRTVNTYGRSSLAKPDTDKLVAISAIAQKIQEQLDDKYIAGLWRKNLIGDLLWSVDRTRQHVNGMVPDRMYDRTWDLSRRAVTYRVPSWSWASVDGDVLLGPYLDVSGKPWVR
jgi:hypothetical protein